MVRIYCEDYNDPIVISRKLAEELNLEDGDVVGPNEFKKLMMVVQKEN